MNKKTLAICGLSLAILGSGAFAYSSLSSAQEVETGQASSVETSTSSSSTPETQAPVESSTPQVSSSQETETSTPAPELSKLEQEHEAFAQEAVKQDFYLEEPDSQGKLTYVKATDEKVKELTEDAVNNKVSIYQIEYNGEMISVLSTTN
ncbi:MULTISPECIES: hypothetical protein [Lactobacillales]|nr:MULTISPECIES: hypothetical protein [Lactobacillales]NHI80066.1 hypothetical protein [Lactococcus petauri]